MRKLCRAALLLVLFLSSVVCAEAQQRQLKGRITDQSGQPLSGVTIKVKENNATAVTENDGTFTINAPASSKTLQVSSIGYASQEVSIGNQSDLSIKLQNSATEMSDVVGVGYGTSRKKDLTGAVGSVKSAQLTQVGTADVVQAMQGRVSGVQVVSNSGEPGAGSKILIRGIGSVNGSNPIYVVDGYQTGNIGFLAPGDIESIDVLKDASATAIYGSRGANGVVLITTKKGKRGPVRFTIDSYAGVQQARRTIPMLNASKFATLVLEGYENDGTVLPETSDLYNTHLHVLEAYTAFYKVHKDELLRQQLSNLVDLFVDKFYDPVTGHNRLFFDDHWNSRSKLVSYGHDIEASWLIWDAAQTVGKNNERVKEVCLHMAQSSLFGVDQDGGMWYEYDASVPFLNREKHWWPQAEAMVGFYNAFRISGDLQYLEKSKGAWNYIKSQIIDEHSGEWLWGRDPLGQPMKEDLAGFWKCPYHNGRALMEMNKRGVMELWS